MAAFGVCIRKPNIKRPRTDYRIAKTDVHFHTVCRCAAYCPEKEARKAVSCKKIGAALNIQFTLSLLPTLYTAAILSDVCISSVNAMTTKKIEIGIERKRTRDNDKVAKENGCLFVEITAKNNKSTKPQKHFV